MCPMREITMEVIGDDNGADQNQELEVHFFPPLNLQRRIWILNIIRRDNITQVLDVGCGEGELLSTLSQVAPWLPPPSPLLESDPKSPASLTSPISAQLNPTNRQDPDSIPNIHPRYLHGLDISAEDLKFAIQLTKAPEVEDYDDPISPYPSRRYSTNLTRFEELDVKIWKGGLEVINEEFVNIECIVSSEVIEHLPPSILPFFAPMMLGVYHPRNFLMTTPSYTFNARFTAPDAPSSARKGYPDPTQRTDRIFRHDDHKFEWTTKEFETWVNDAATTWGYSVHWASIGRALTADPYGRDDELGGASFVAEFRKLGEDVMTDEQREKRGRETVKNLPGYGLPHELLAHHYHPAHPFSRKPRPFLEIAQIVKDKMEEYRESLMRIEEVWYEGEVAAACGGWLEVLVQAIEESADLTLKKEEDGVQRKRDSWTVELVGANWNGEQSDSVPPDWMPGEGSWDAANESDFGGSTGVEGDVSLCNSEEDTAAWSPDFAAGTDWGWKPYRSAWGGTDVEEDDSDSVTNSWGDIPTDQKKQKRIANPFGFAKKERERNERDNSTAGWDGDADSDTE